MVALKRVMEGQEGPPDPGKQERRGGIETRPGRRRSSSSQPRSRNAVVALKPGSVDVHPIGDLRKQERRGGIETTLRILEHQGGVLRSRNAVVALKHG